MNIEEALNKIQDWLDEQIDYNESIKSGPQLSTYRLGYYAGIDLAYRDTKRAIGAVQKENSEIESKKPNADNS